MGLCVLRTVHPFIVAAAGLLSGCGDAGSTAGPAAPSRPASISIAPASVTLTALADTAQLTATVLDQNETPMQGVAVVWATSDGSVATVSAGGTVTAVWNGNATITASVQGGGPSGSAQVTVAQEVATVRVTPNADTLRALGDTARLTGRALDANGHVVQDATLGWSSSDEAVVSVDGSGLVTAAGNGRATVTAQSGPVAGSADFTVEQQATAVQISPADTTLYALGDTVRLTAAGVDANGNAVGDDAERFTWISTDETVVTVNASGLATAMGSGSATIRATGEVSGTSASAEVTVAQRVTEIRLSPTPDTLRALEDTVRLSASASDANGRAAEVAEIVWSSGDTTVARVDTTGLVTAAGNGTTDVRAMSGNVAARVGVTVVQRALEMRVTPSADTLWVAGDTLRLDAAVVDANGHPLAATGSTLHWSSSDASVARVDGTGLVTAVAEGRADITVRSEETAFSGTATVWVYMPGERDILIAFYNATNGPHWLRNDNWLTDAPLDSWHGVETDGQGRVTGLDLLLNRLTGRLPPELGSLRNLRVISLTHNSLTGSIPREMGRLQSLESIRLGNNRITGEIPRELGDLANLENLVLSGNGMAGAIPPELGNLRKLRWLDLGQNPIAGDIPPELGSLSELLGLHLDLTRLSGAIPPSFGGLANLRELDLSRNRLTGAIPFELAALSRLRLLNLFGNQLSGRIPPELGQLANVTELYLSSNDLTGPIPPELANLSKLTHLIIWGNRLVGSIPPELGQLGNLQVLAMGRNELTGLVPPELGNLERLHSLSLHENELTGPIPLSFVDLNLDVFVWQDTQLCAPLAPTFQTWLNSIQDLNGGPGCFVDALKALYEAGGGTSWTRSDNWLTDEPVSSWHGVTMDDEGRITAIDLSSNGLAGTLPVELGALANLVRLDLRDNQLAGQIPAELGEPAALEELYLSRNRFEGSIPGQLGNLSELTSLYIDQNRLAGALPGTLTELARLTDFRWNGSGACAPGVGWFQTWLGSLANHTGGTTCSAAVRLSVSAAHVNQAAQDLAGGVPLIAGRKGLLRVFATADQANDYQPGARAEFFLEGRQIHRSEMQLESTRGIPEDLDPRQPPDQSFHVEVPANVLVPGVEVVVEIDPDSVVPRASGGVDRFPAQGRQALDVWSTPHMALTVVPVLETADPDSSVLEWVAGMEGEHPVIDYVTSVLPVGDYTVAVREPYVRSPIPLSGFQDWWDFLLEITLLRHMENGRGYYYGAIARRRGGISGIATTSGFVSAGRLNTGTMAHELGHNMSLKHAPCGLLFDADPRFPQSDGTIGAWGYDARSGDMVPPSTRDVMSYCDPAWISAYHFDKALRYRQDGGAAPSSSLVAGAERARRLLLWGGLSPEGELRLEPAFLLEAQVKVPSGAGPYRLEGFGPDGTQEFSLAFALEENDLGGGSFLFAIPFEQEWRGSLQRIVLTGPEGAVELSGEVAVPPVAIALDYATGRLRSVLRGEDAATLANTAADGLGTGRHQVLISHGLPWRMPN